MIGDWKLCRSVKKHSGDPFRRLNLLPKCSLRYDIIHLLYIFECRSINIYIRYTAIRTPLKSSSSAKSFPIVFCASMRMAIPFGAFYLPTSSSWFFFTSYTYSVDMSICFNQKKDMDAFSLHSQVGSFGDWSIKV